MTGSSLDAVDAVLVRIQPNDPSILLLDSHSEPLSEPLRADLQALMQPGADELNRAGRLHRQLGECYAQVVATLRTTNPQHTPAFIGSHGQTVRHQPDGADAYTVQLGCAATLAQRSGLPVVADFRSADLAQGGQGAPFAPFFHAAAMQSADETRAVLNLGGIANLTHLPPNAPPVGFDSGPGNALMDLWYQRHHSGPFDAQGSWAATGSPHPALLEALLADPYFRRPPPKSTGRDYFSDTWLDTQLASFTAHCALPPAADIQATLAALTAESIARALRELRPAVEALYLCGGGVHNQFLCTQLTERLSMPCHSTAALGYPPQAVEAMAFAWLAGETLARRPSTLPSVTGARRATIAGAVYYP